jgi:hypothetical protein
MHWDTVYGTTSLTEVSWYEQVPATSLRLIASVASPTDAVVDVGAGASFVADTLLAQGFEDVTVLDVSAEALATVRIRLADRPGAHFVVTDLLAWQPARQYDTWHDRAVFHFLVDKEARDRYAAAAAAALPVGGALIVGAFAHDGPTSCSGLPTARYTPDALAAQFAADFTEEQREREEHVTPSGVTQPFTWLVLRRR